MYKMNTRVRYSEVDQNRMTTMTQIVNYFQDCSTFHSEDIGVGLDYLYQQHRAWLLLGWQIEVERFPTFGESIDIGTWAYEFKGMLGYRNFDIVDQQGKRIASANSIWTYIDTDTNHPVKPEGEAILKYELNEPLSMEYLPRKIKVPNELIEKEPFQILKMHIDTNHHVNNSKYIEFALEYLEKGFVIGRMRAEYKQAAVLGDMIYPKISKEQDNVVVALNNEEDKPYVVVEFTRKKEV